MKHRITFAALLAWPAACHASEPGGLFLLLFGLPSLLLSVVFAAVALKAPRFGGVLCGLLLISVVPLVFWAERVGYMDDAGAWLWLAIAVLVAGLLVSVVKILRPSRETTLRGDGN
jgi:hypothetical protein